MNACDVKKKVEQLGIIYYQCRRLGGEGQRPPKRHTIRITAGVGIKRDCKCKKKSMVRSSFFFFSMVNSKPVCQLIGCQQAQASFWRFGTVATIEGFEMELRVCRTTMNVLEWIWLKSDTSTMKGSQGILQYKVLYYIFLWLACT